MLEDDVPVPNTSIPGPSTATAPQEDTDEADLGPPPVLYRTGCPTNYAPDPRLRQA